MSQRPTDYGRGLGLGQYKQIPSQIIRIPLDDVDMAFDKDQAISREVDLFEIRGLRRIGSASSAINAVAQKGGGLAMITNAADLGLTGGTSVFGVGEFSDGVNTPILVVFDPAGWRRWNGAAWLALGGGYAEQPFVTAVMMQGMLIAASSGAPSRKLKSWDGVDAHNVQDLSATAPNAKYITPIGNRLLAAVIDSGAGYDYNKIAWSTDGDVTDWATLSLGAGSSLLLPNTRVPGSGIITGLQTNDQGAIIFRDGSLVFGTPTGVGARPFNWTTLTAAGGVLARCSRSIVNIPGLGVVFLGQDGRVRVINNSAITTISEPVDFAIRTQLLYSGAIFVGSYDPTLATYTLSSGVAGFDEFTFDVAEYMSSGRKRWYVNLGGCNVTFPILMGTSSKGNVYTNGITRIGQMTRVSSASALGNGPPELSVAFGPIGAPDRWTKIDRVGVLMSDHDGSGLTIFDLSYSLDSGETWTIFGTQFPALPSGSFTRQLVSVPFQLALKAPMLRIRDQSLASHLRTVWHEIVLTGVEDRGPVTF